MLSLILISLFGLLSALCGAAVAVPGIRAGQGTGTRADGQPDGFGRPIRCGSMVKRAGAPASGCDVVADFMAVQTGTGRGHRGRGEKLLAGKSAANGKGRGLRPPQLALAQLVPSAARGFHAFAVVGAGIAAGLAAGFGGGVLS